MGYIYALMCEQLCLYVGSTVNLTIRENKHRSKKSNTCASRHIPEHITWVMTELEECPDDVMRIREQFWYDTLMPLYNELRPHNELTHIERVKEYQQSESYKQKLQTEEYKRYNREAQRKFQAKKRAERALIL